MLHTLGASGHRAGRSRIGVAGKIRREVARAAPVRVKGLHHNVWRAYQATRSGRTKNSESWFAQHWQHAWNR